MFDLENSIDKWLSDFRKQRAFDEGALQEMEQHVRDHIEDLVQQGMSDKEAFENAVHSFGDILHVANEDFSNYRRKRSLLSMIQMALVRNYYSVAMRNLLKHRNYFLINVLGLSIGIASFTFLGMYVANELSYDRFHSNYDQIYAVTSPAVIRGEPNHDARSSVPLAKALLDEYPEINISTRILKTNSMLIGEKGDMINEEGVLFADPHFFEVFDFKLIQGNPKNVLTEPRTLVLTESYVKKYFGNLNPVGQELLVGSDEEAYKITGIVKDPPANSHIKFKLVGSVLSKDEWNSNSWIGGYQYTYAVLDEGTDPTQLEKKMKELFYRNMAPQIEYFTGMSIKNWEGSGNEVNYHLTPIKDIHLNNSFTSGEFETTGNIRYIYIYSLIGVVILFIAIFNFVNLATAHSSARAKEVGVRKVIGSSRRNLVFQFITESIVISLFATVLAAIIVMATTPSFFQLIGKDLAFHLTDRIEYVLLLFVTAILVGILSGFYPALILSSFSPVEVLKGKLKSGMKSGWLRNLLVTLQFSAAIIIVIVTMVIYRQINFMLNKSLGFEKEQVLVIEQPDWLGKNLDVFKEEVVARSGILQVTNSLTLPGKQFEIRSYRKKDERQVYLFLNNQVNYEYLDMMGVELIAGRFFSKNFPSDSNAVVINEAAVAKFGFDDPIGKPLISAFKKDRPLKIIGVVKNYNVESLHKEIEPVSLELDTQSNGFLTLKIAARQNMLEALDHTEELWKTHANGKPFSFYFFDEDYEKIYQSETNTGRILVVFASLSIFIACLGLIGLITYTASVRTREIGIRKVLGAGSFSLIRLLSMDTIKLVSIATLVGWPLAYFASDYWLQNFADRIEVDLWVFIISTVTLVAIVGLAISFQTIRTTKSNPVDSLRQD